MSHKIGICRLLTCLAVFAPNRGASCLFALNRPSISSRGYLKRHQAVPPRSP